MTRALRSRIFLSWKLFASEKETSQKRGVSRTVANKRVGKVEWAELVGSIRTWRSKDETGRRSLGGSFATVEATVTSVLITCQRGTSVDVLWPGVCSPRGQCPAPLESRG